MGSDTWESNTHLNHALTRAGVLAGGTPLSHLERRTS